MKKILSITGMLALCLALFGCGPASSNSSDAYTVQDFGSYTIEVPNDWEKTTVGNAGEIYSSPDGKASVSITNQKTDIKGMSLEEQYEVLLSSPDLIEGMDSSNEKIKMGDYAGIKSTYTMGGIDGTDMLFFVSDTEQVVITIAFLEGATDQDKTTISHVVDSITLKTP